MALPWVQEWRVEIHFGHGCGNHFYMGEITLIGSKARLAEQLTKRVEWQRRGLQFPVELGLLDVGVALRS